ncbi:hypothetical protein [Nesterenkonia sandarakina]|uniref:Uncharacterized protein n=1 Tax=Nesterenkonia sandarakina TaxID=272918 RepID=A0A7Z0E6S6_9MICC|nr:hypothetical protein [Nesterenkonia sandarakina]NYJ15700.1 hypothetical protein [Nesterenkonia sandarakina]
MSNTTQSPSWGVTRTLGTTAALGIAALALIGCGAADEDPRVEENPQEDLDPSGAEDQGVSSDEIAENEDDQQAADIAEIEEEIWAASMEGESVSITMTAGLDRGHELFGYAPDFYEGEGESFELAVSGELEGDATTRLDYTPEFEVRSFGDEVYQSLEAFVFDYQAQVPPEVEPEVDAAQLDTALRAEGEWVDVSTAEPAVPRTPAAVLEMLRAEITESLEVDSLAELDLDSTVDTREGQNVWVYSNEDMEIAVLADSDSPALVGLVLPGETEDLEATLSDWDEAETPEQPEEDTVINDEQLQEILNALV